MIARRQFLTFMAAAPAMGKVPVRDAGRVETVFKTPGPHPNGLQATQDGLWVIDGDNGRAFIVRYEDGKALPEFATDCVKLSGITDDGERLGWPPVTAGRSSVLTDASVNFSPVPWNLKTHQGKRKRNVAQLGLAMDERF